MPNIPTVEIPIPYPIIIIGTDDNDILAGTQEDDAIDGRDGNDDISGGVGDDAISGDQGNDTIDGGEGNDLIFGHEGDDSISGGNGDDTLVGVNPTSELEPLEEDILIEEDTPVEDGPKLGLGSFEQDILIGGADKDRFVLGDQNSLYYNDIDPVTPGEDDYALIRDFTAGEDVIELYGASELYSLDFYTASDGTIKADVIYDPGVAARGELIGILENVTPDLELTDSSFIYGENDYEIRYNEIFEPLINLEPGFYLNLLGWEGNDLLICGCSLIYLSDVGEIPIIDYYDTINGGFIGNTTIEPDTPPNIIEGTSEDDILVGTDGRDIIYGFQGNDHLSGLGGNDTIFGGEGDDTILGGEGNDSLSGGSGEDVISGEEGNDSLAGEDGNDLLSGGFGLDTISGGEGDDSLSGGSGNDVINGEGGNDSIAGGDGEDTLIGIALDSGGAFERDTLSGGLGADYFILGDETQVYYDDGDAVSLGESDFAFITDFNSSEDFIELSGPIQFYQLDFYTISDGIINAALMLDPGVTARRELIGIIQEVSVDLNLTDDSFIYHANSQLETLVVNETPSDSPEDTITEDSDNTLEEEGNITPITNNNIINTTESEDETTVGESFSEDSSNNEIFGTEGNDDINGLDGDDSLFGDEGEDSENTLEEEGNITPITNNNIINTTESEDETTVDESFSGDSGNNEIFGTEGNDDINGLDGDDSLFGDEGEDVVNGGVGI